MIAGGIAGPGGPAGTTADPEQLIAVALKQAGLSGVNIDKFTLEQHAEHGAYRSELHDLDLERGVIMVHEGKGKHDRMTPIGERALMWIDKYIADVRDEYTSGAD